MQPDRWLRTDAAGNAGADGVTLSLTRGEIGSYQVNNPDGSARRIDASSGGGNGVWKWLLPLLLGLALLGLLFWLLARRRRDGFILEPDVAADRREQAGTRRR